jgi:formate dehydrogenase accessory protein FdhD
MSELAAVEEVPVWLEVNGRPVVTWMCTPDLLEELAIGWLHGEGYIDRLDEVHLRPCATDLGFWAEVPAERVAAVQAEAAGLCWHRAAAPFHLPSGAQHGGSAASRRPTRARASSRAVQGPLARATAIRTLAVHAAALVDPTALVAGVKPA